MSFDKSGSLGFLPTPAFQRGLGRGHRMPFVPLSEFSGHNPSIPYFDRQCNSF